MSKKCRLLPRKAHYAYQGKMYLYKSFQCPSTFGSCCGAKSTSKSKCTKHTSSEHFLKLRCWKKVRAFVVHTTFRSQKSQRLTVSGRFRCRFARQAQGAPCQKKARHEGLGEVAATTTTTPHHTPLCYATVQLKVQLRYILCPRLNQ